MAYKLLQDYFCKDITNMIGSIMMVDEKIVLERLEKVIEELKNYHIAKDVKYYFENIENIDDLDDGDFMYRYHSLV